MSDLTPEEAAFFETGDVAKLGLAAPEPASEPAEQQAEQQAEPASQEPVVEAAPAAPLVDTSGLENLLTQRLADLEARIAELNKPKPAVEEVPDPTTDPLGHMMHQLNSVNRQVAELQTKLTQEQQQAALRSEYDQFTANVRAMRDEFAKTTPDFNDAYAHIRSVRTADLLDSGVPKAEVPKMLLQDELRLAQTALAAGKNPAEAMYNMAKRYGYTAKAAPAQQAAAPKPAETPEQKIERLANGQFAARQPSKAAPEAEITLSGLKDAGDNDLNKVVLDDKMWKQVVGGKAGTDIFH